MQQLSLIFNSIRLRLVLLVLAVAGPAALTTALLVSDAYRQQQAITHQQLLETVRALSLVVDRQIGEAETLLEALATSPYLDSEDFAAFHRQANASIRHQGMRVVLLDENYRQLVNTGVAFGTALPLVGPRETGARWTAMADSRAKLSNLIMGRLPADLHADLADPEEP